MSPQSQQVTPISGLPRVPAGRADRRAALPRRHPRDVRAARLRLDRDPGGRAARAAARARARTPTRRSTRLAPGRRRRRRRRATGRLGLHFDLTVPFARYVLENAGKLEFPFRRYQIQKVWRGERPQEGRYREFTQADIDVVDVGALPPHYEAEMPLVMAEAFSELPVGAVPDPGQQPQDPRGLLPRHRADRRRRRVLRIVDKLDKIGPDEGRRRCWSEAGRPTEQAARVPGAGRDPSPTTSLRRAGARPRRRAPDRSTRAWTSWPR